MKKNKKNYKHIHASAADLLHIIAFAKILER